MVDSYAGIVPESLEGTLDHHLRLADGEIDAAIAAAGDAASVLEHLELAGRHARRGYGRTASLTGMHPDAAVRAAAGDAQTRFDAWRTATFARPDL
ncbi:MAG TPA: hypothetical protein VFQ75_02060, partial [Candidatus Limnocylindrales bacterium]|nr:hypothetical protein [Candidatus Limnocylindrales bacterium]